MPAGNLHEINCSLRALLDRLSPAKPEALPAAFPQLIPLLSELLQVGEWVRCGVVCVSDPEMGPEIQQYRELIGRALEILPGVQAQLLAERARLESERSQIEAAGAWATASRLTT